MNKFDTIIIQLLVELLIPLHNKSYKWLWHALTCLANNDSLQILAFPVGRSVPVARVTDCPQISSKDHVAPNDVGGQGQCSLGLVPRSQLQKSAAVEKQEVHAVPVCTSVCVCLCGWMHAYSLYNLARSKMGVWHPPRQLRYAWYGWYA